jgi:hypothetical protein
MNRTRRPPVSAALALALVLAGCGGETPAPNAPAAPTSASNVDPPATAAASSAPTPADTAAPSAPTPAAAQPVAEPVDEAKLAAEVGADYAKLLQLAKLSDKAHKAIVKHLYKAVRECDGKLVDAQAVPGVIVAKPVKLRAEVLKSLEAAGAIAQQRGMAIDVVGGAQSVKDAVAEYNRALLEKTIALAKAASPADRKEKSFVGEARKAVGESPKDWGERPCDAGRIGGWSVVAQLVTVDASGKPKDVLVKANADASRFAKDTFESIYWEKKKGKSFRTLTEIMSAGKFVRRCSDATIFFTSPTTDGSWRCKEDADSWDPPNRPLPAWQ